MLVVRMIREDELVRHDKPGWPAPIPEPENVMPKLPINPKRKNLREEAERWIKENPSAYSALEAAALSSLAAGTPMTMELLIGWARKNTSAKKDDDGFKINDHHGAYLARRLAADFPQLEKCFRFRKTRY